MTKHINVYGLSLMGKRTVAGFEKFNDSKTFWEDMVYLSELKANEFDGLEQEKRIISFYRYLGKFTDFAFGGIGFLCFNQHVVDVFGDELLDYGRLYPINVQDAPSQYYLYHVTKLVKAMDLDAVSQIDSRYQPGEQYNMLSNSKIEFISENIKDLLVFKDIQQDPGHRDIYLGQRFVDILKKHKFTGVHKDTFKPIWPRPEVTQPQTGPRVDLADLNL